MAVSSVRYRGPRGKPNKLSVGRVCRVILSHPFVLVGLLYLIILHRYFPFLFSLLVSASPVLICTALLLGTLLIHGQRNDYRVGNREERSKVIEISNNGVVDYAYTADRDGMFGEDRLGEVRNGIVEKEMTVSRGFTTSDRDYNNARLRRSTDQEEENKQGFQFAKFDFQDVQMHNLNARNFDEKYDKTLDVQHDVGVQDHSDSSFNSHKNVDNAADYESSYSESDGAEKSCLDALVADGIPTPQETHPLLVSEDPLHSQTLHDALHDATHESVFKSEVQSLGSNHSSEVSDEETDYMDEEEEDEKDDDVEEDDSPKGKDGDSQSPFAWTDNDQRILQELRSSEIEKNEHLESLIARAEDDESDEMEDEDDVGISEDIDDDVDVEVDVDDDEEEDENVGVEKDGGKHVTLWTEEDEKNLRHLGCSELERNLRLENLLARRRAKRNFSMISERNLIDLDHADLPFPVAPITTTRVNPFDAPDNTNHHPSMPPIPGSAPSVSLPRKNPFDSPCTSPRRTHNLSGETAKEKSVELNLNNAVHHEIGSSSSGYNATGHVSKPDFVDTSRKEALFRRYESFSTGYNLMAEDSTDDYMEFDRRDFVFRRHETFNTRTTFPNFFSSDRPVFVPEHHGEMRLPSFKRQSSRDSESAESESGSDTESSNAPVSQEYEGRDEEAEEAFEHHQDSEAPHEGDHTSSHAETGSESSEAPDYNDQHEHFSGSMEVNVDHIYDKQEVLNESHESHESPDTTSSSSSSPSSSPRHHVEGVVNESQTEHQQVQDSGFSPEGSFNTSEASHMSTGDDHHPVKHEQVQDSVFSPKESEASHKSTGDDHHPVGHQRVEDSGSLLKDSLNLSEASHLSTDDDHHHVEPVYDTSPSSVEKSTAFSLPSEVLGK